MIITHYSLHQFYDDMLNSQWKNNFSTRGITMLYKYLEEQDEESEIPYTMLSPALAVLGYQEVNVGDKEFVGLSIDASPEEIEANSRFCCWVTEDKQSFIAMEE